MSIQLRYAHYIFRHKWFVFLECCKAGYWWLGLLHDLSKLRPDEWRPYAEYFYGGKANDKDFDFAWLLHQKRNKHHWQWWVLPEDEGGVKLLEMQPKYRNEMLCDWKGAGRALGKTDTRAWYIAHRDKMRLGVLTREWIEYKLGAQSQGVPGEDGK